MIISIHCDKKKLYFPCHHTNSATIYYLTHHYPLHSSCIFHHLQLILHFPIPMFSVNAFIINNSKKTDTAMHKILYSHINSFGLNALFVNQLTLLGQVNKHDGTYSNNAHNLGNRLLPNNYTYTAKMKTWLLNSICTEN